MARAFTSVGLLCINSRFVTRKTFAKSGIWLKLFQQTNNCFLKTVASTHSTPLIEDSLFISDACVQQMKTVALRDQFLRVIVEGGGCSGFTYKFELDAELQEDDRVFEKDGTKVVTDEDSLNLIKGSTVDYHTELIKSAFRIKDNPQSKTSCSCGVSFAVDL